MAFAQRLRPLEEGADAEILKEVEHARKQLLESPHDTGLRVLLAQMVTRYLQNSDEDGAKQVTTTMGQLREQLTALGANEAAIAADTLVTVGMEVCRAYEAAKPAPRSVVLRECADILDATTNMLDGASPEERGRLLNQYNDQSMTIAINLGLLKPEDAPALRQCQESLNRAIDKVNHIFDTEGKDSDAAAKEFHRLHVLKVRQFKITGRLEALTGTRAGAAR